MLRYAWVDGKKVLQERRAGIAVACKECGNHYFKYQYVTVDMDKIPSCIKGKTPPND
jgi:hypothetical protein